VPSIYDLLAFFKTINEDSDISADAAPLRFALTLDEADSELLELAEVWLTALLSKQLLI
jgi:hypothetical protein